MEHIIQWDQEVLIFINGYLQNSFFDILLPLVRNKYIWIPVYIGIITYIFTKFSLYRASYYLLFIISAVAITDITSGQLLKKYIQRQRPCNEIGIAQIVNERVYCSHSYSFPSSHAANHFGLALILFALLGRSNYRIKYLLFGWAAIISFAQVYVGIHYPLDVIGGAILGIVLIRIYIALINPLIIRLSELPASE